MNPQNSIEVKLTAHGRYVWKINVIYDKNYKEAISEIKAIDDKLKDEFPDSAKKASGRVVNFEED